MVAGGVLGSQWAFGSVCCGRWWQHDSGAGCGCAQVSGWRSVGGGGGGHASREPRAPWAGRVARVLPRALSSGGPLACVGEGAAATAHAFSGRGRSAEWLGKFFERVCNKRRKQKLQAKGGLHSCTKEVLPREGMCRSRCPLPNASQRPSRSQGSRQNSRHHPSPGNKCPGLSARMAAPTPTATSLSDARAHPHPSPLSCCHHLPQHTLPNDHCDPNTPPTTTNMRRTHQSH